MRFLNKLSYFMMGFLSLSAINRWGDDAFIFPVVLFVVFFVMAILSAATDKNKT